LFNYDNSIKHEQLLHFAAIQDFSDHIEVINYLLDKEAFINSVMFENSSNSYEQKRFFELDTSLFSVVATECLDMTNMLLSREANSSIKNSRGKLTVKKVKYHD